MGIVIARDIHILTKVVTNKSQGFPGALLDMPAGWCWLLVADITIKGKKNVRYRSAFFSSSYTFSKLTLTRKFGLDPC
jgi:hypothetical protein